MIPPWSGARVVDRAPPLARGSRVSFDLKLFGVKRGWLAEHEDVVPGKRFVDRQISGPFKSWRHCHEFEDVGEAQCRLTDRIEFEMPLGGLGKTTALRELERMFAYRHEVVKRDVERYYKRLHKPTFAITGASGFLGSCLSNFLKAQGCKVLAITRCARFEDDIQWNPQERQLEASRLEGVDVIVNLAGSNVASGRWSGAMKKDLTTSRIESLRTIKGALTKMKRPPKLLISASGIGFYGNDCDEPTTEEAKAGKGFLAQLSKEWEQAALDLGSLVERVVIARTGLVLDSGAGALKKMLPVFSAGLGGRLGNADQWMPWIGVEDWIRAIDFLSEEKNVSGIYNLCSEEPVRNEVFTKALGQVLKRPTLLPVPEFALKLIFGEMAEETLLASTRSLPGRLAEAGFTFAYPTLEGALRFSLGRYEG